MRFDWKLAFFDAARARSTCTAFDDRCNDGMTCCGLAAFGWLPTVFDATRARSTSTVFEGRCNDGTTVCGLAAFDLLPTFLDATCAIGPTCIVFEGRFNDGLLNPFAGGKGMFEDSFNDGLPKMFIGALFEYLFNGGATFRGTVCDATRARPTATFEGRFNDGSVALCEIATIWAAGSAARENADNLQAMHTLKHERQRIS